MFKKHYRLGIDMGSSSIGWAMILLDESDNPIGIERMGVRIFPDGRDAKSHEPLSVSRRKSRGARRNSDRHLERMRGLIKLLDDHGFLPKTTEARKEVFAKNPYELRTKALDEQVSEAEFARALIHLAKRRGFLSNRRTDGDEKTSEFKTAIENLSNRLAESGARTIGEYLYNKMQSEASQHKLPSLRFRYDVKNDPNSEPIFPRRDMIVSEFTQIWDKQQQYYPKLGTAIREDIFHSIFDQRPLMPMEKGRCIFEPTELRAPKAHPIFQEYRILQDLNNFEVEDVIEQKHRPLTIEERRIVLDALCNAEAVEYKSLRYKLYKKHKDDFRFNFETENKKKVLGDQTSHRFRNRKDSNIPLYWESLNFEKKCALVELLCSDLDDDKLRSELVAFCNLQELAEELFNMRLPSGYGNISVKALNKILPYMRDGHKYHEACKLAGYNHSETYDGRVYQDADLPYYGELLRRSVLPLNRKTKDYDADEFGKINNPTVHIALNQLRKIINTLVKVYGPPTQIVLELARDLKMGEIERAESERKQRKNTQVNERIAKELEHSGIENNYENRTRYKLWEELSQDPLQRKCVYTGRQISIEKLFSAEFEIEHILPKSRTYDDSISNKTISYYVANRYKGERSPYEAFGESNDSYDWNAIIERSANLPGNKRRRFLKDAMERYADENEVLARMLNDTRYMSKVAKEYLQYVVGDRNIWVVTGQQTAMFRAKWGLNKTLHEDASNSKNRSDHRHHAIDAFVIAMMSRSTINRFSHAVKDSRDRYLEKLGDPYPGFDHNDFATKVHSIKTSYKPDHMNPHLLSKRNQTAGPLLKDTAYGFIGPDPNDKNYHIYTERAPITGLSAKDVDRIIDPVLKSKISILLTGNAEKNVISARLKHFSDEMRINKIKLKMRANPDTMIGVKDKAGKIYKYYSSGENLYIDIYCPKPWDPESPWKAEIVNSYNAHQEDFAPKWKDEYPMAKLIMRLFKNDIVCIDAEAGREFLRVRKITKGIVFLRHINISMKPKGVEDIGETHSANRLKEMNTRKAGIDIIGRAFDPYREAQDAGIGDQP